MALDIWNISRLAAKSLLVAGIAVIAASGSARAGVLISSGATINITCAGGVCAPTKRAAVLNVAQLQTLLASGNVKVTTAGSEASDIVVSANLNWASANSLALDAYQSITINKAVSVNGTGGLALTTNDGGTSGILSFGQDGHVGFLSTANSLTINGAAYTLIGDTTTLASDIASNPGGNFALASNYNATGNPSFVITTFNGNFEGLGNAISNLRIATNLVRDLGLFSVLGSSGSVTNINLEKVTVVPGQTYYSGALVGLNEGLLQGDAVAGGISAPGAADVGGLVGNNDLGSIINCHSSVHVSVGGYKQADAESYVGGLVGANNGSISNSYATGAIKSLNHDFDGGLVGFNDGGVIANSFSTGSVAAGDGTNAGGLVGYNASSTNSSGSGGVITSSYSTGTVAAGSSSYEGGLIGFEESVDPNVSSYWDTTTSGITNQSQGAGNISNVPGITGLSNTQLQTGLPAGFSSAIWGQNTSINGGLPYLLALPPAK